MATTDDIGWGSYRQYSGPFHRGKHPYKLPADHQQHDRILAVTTATEGGRYDAINMYDGQVMSTTLIQLIERSYYKTSQFLGHLSRYGNSDPLMEFLRRQDAQLAQERKRWHFYDRQERVDTLEEQRDFFYDTATGEKGTWDDESKDFAKRWAAVVATLCEDKMNQALQRSFLLPTLKDYCFGMSRGLVDFALMEKSNPLIAEAFVAAYISFAVNSPVRAAKHLKKVGQGGGPITFNKDWLIKVLKELTFGPKIAIYPHRYNAIRPVLEKLYNIDLPDFADELKEWKKDTGLISLSTVEVQKALLALGEDLGPAGADGKYGRKTRNAVLNLELRSELPREFCDGMLDEHSYRIFEEALARQGVVLLGESP